MFCSNANQGLAKDLRNVVGYAEPISKLEEAGLLGKENIFNNGKQFGEFLNDKKGKIVKSPGSFSDKQKEVFDEIYRGFLGRDSIRNLNPNSTSI
jgi:hypothetical protein